MVEPTNIEEKKKRILPSKGDFHPGQLVNLPWLPVGTGFDLEGDGRFILEPLSSEILFSEILFLLPKL